MTTHYQKRNNNLYKLTYLSLFSLLLFFNFGCRKGCTDPNALNYDPTAKKDNNTCEYDSTSTETNISLITFHYYDSDGFYLDSIYQDDFGNNIKFSRANFYFGNPIYYNSTGQKIASSNSYTLISSTEAIYDFGDAPTDLINTMDVIIGVDSITNHIDPANYPSSNSLSYQSPSMHWQMGTAPQNWSYLFIVLEGQVDIDGNGTFDSGETFVYHIGGDDFRAEINAINWNPPINQLATYTIEIDINWANFVNNIDMSADVFTHTMDNIPLATTISTNAVTVISEH
jgi:hypothetical protein